MATSTVPALQVPFSSSPDPTAFFLTPTLRQMVFKIGYSLDARQGLAVVLGDFGLGKSTLLRYLFAKFSALDHNEATFLPSPSFKTSFSMLQKICADFDIGPARSEMAQREAFESFLIAKAQDGKNVLLFIDEAQGLKTDQLELVRTLLNFETNTQKLVQIVLAGQLELRDRLRKKKYRALASRAFAPVLMAPLQFPEMVQMLRARCDLHQISWPFAQEEPLKILFEATGGVPRLVLVASQIAYALMGSADRKTIDASLIGRACEDLQILQEPEHGKK